MVGDRPPVAAERQDLARPRGRPQIARAITGDGAEVQVELRAVVSAGAVWPTVSETTGLGGRHQRTGHPEAGERLDGGRTERQVLEIGGYEHHEQPHR